MSQRVMDESDESQPFRLAFDLQRHRAGGEPVYDRDRSVGNGSQYASGVIEISGRRIRKSLADNPRCDAVAEPLQAVDDVFVVDVAAGELRQRTGSNEREQITSVLQTMPKRRAIRSASRACSRW